MPRQVVTLELYFESISSAHLRDAVDALRDSGSADRRLDVVGAAAPPLVVALESAVQAFAGYVASGDAEVHELTVVVPNRVDARAVLGSSAISWKSAKKCSVPLLSVSMSSSSLTGARYSHRDEIWLGQATRTGFCGKPR